MSRLALQRNRYSEMTDTDFSFALQQIEGRQRTREKLPFLDNYPEWWFPKRLSTEQCSSEVTARYKRSFRFQVSGFKVQVSGFKVQGSGFKLVDLTGGMGIDTLFLAELFKEVHYVERDEELCRIAEHNFGLTSSREVIKVHHSEAEDFLQQLTHADLIYIDPARRAASGRKVFRIEDCEPDVACLLPVLKEKCPALLLKLSPMLDLSAALTSLPGAREVHIVAVRGEVKEVLVIVNSEKVIANSEVVEIHCVNLETKDEELVFTMKEEREAECEYAEEAGEYIFEPNAAIMKAGAFKTVAKRYGVKKLGVNTHLYTSDRLIENWSGRVWRITAALSSIPKKGERLKMNIVSRNYPLSADEIRRHYKIEDGGEKWLIATRVAEKKAMFLAERVQ